MARSKVADGGTATTMEGSCEYFDKQSQTADKGWPSRLGGLREVLTAPRLKTYHVTKQSNTCNYGDEPSGSTKCGEFLD